MGFLRGRLLFAFSGQELSADERRAAISVFAHHGYAFIRLRELIRRDAGVRYGCAHFPLPVEKVEAGTDHDQPTDDGPAVRDIAEYEEPERGRPDELRVDERRTRRGRRQPVPADEQVVPAAAECAAAHHTD